MFSLTKLGLSTLCSFLVFWPHPWHEEVSSPGIEPSYHSDNVESLTTGPPGNSWPNRFGDCFLFFPKKKFFLNHSTNCLWKIFLSFYLNKGEVCFFFFPLLGMCCYHLFKNIKKSVYVNKSDPLNTLTMKQSELFEIKTPQKKYSRCFINICQLFKLWDSYGRWWYACADYTIFRIFTAYLWDLLPEI